MHVNGTYSAVPQTIPKIADKLNHVHVSEPSLAPAPASEDALVPVLQTLRSHGYAHAVSIEMARPERGLDDVKNAVQRLVAAIAKQEAIHA